MAVTKDTDAELRRYYASRAREYEEIFHKPERQLNLRVLEKVLPEMLAGRRVLELACGTGYWTQFITRKAKSILAVDAATETLEVAKAKQLAADRVEYRMADVYDLPADLGSFDGAFAGFWWSHVPVREQPRFLASLDRHLNPQAKVVLLDNVYVEGSSTPISRRDESGDTYQVRRLSNGSEHVVLKNFPSEQALRNAVEPYGHNCQYLRLEFYWVFTYEKR